MSSRSTEIDVRRLKQAIDDIFAHLVDDLGIESIKIDNHLYWEVDDAESFDMSKTPEASLVGDICDDMDFVRLVSRGQAGDATINLIHVAPLLSYIAKTVGR